MDSNLRCGPQGSQTQMPRRTRQELSKHVNHSDLRLQEHLRHPINCWENKHTNIYAYIYIYKHIWKEIESEVTQPCPTLCKPMDYSLPLSSVCEIFQARVLEWVAISFSRGSSRLRDRTRVSCTVERCFTSESPGKSRTHIHVYIMSGECVISLVLSHHVKNLKPSDRPSALSSRTDPVGQISGAAQFYLENKRKIPPRGMRACRPKRHEKKRRESEPRPLGSSLYALLLPRACPM